MMISSFIVYTHPRCLYSRQRQYMKFFRLLAWQKLNPFTFNGEFITFNGGMKIGATGNRRVDIVETIILNKVDNYI